MASTEDLGDMETWLMPALIPLGSSPVGRVPGRPGRPARTYTHRPRTHRYMPFRQDIHARNIHAHFRGGCKMERFGSATSYTEDNIVGHDGNHSTTTDKMGRFGSAARQKTRQCVMMEVIVQPRIANAFVSQDCVSLERRLAPRLVTIPTIDHHAQRRTTILTHSSSTATLKHPSALHTRFADLQAAVLQEEAEGLP